MRVNYEVREQGDYQLKLLAAETGKSQKELMAEALNLLFTEHDKPEVA